ncbi:EndoU domain-containing protein [Clostridium sporogenes]|uniref:EndoU domain-containing protein n=3 Tax=Clostridium sporogenes TaxID=1509 RepID=UPI002237002E|nr:EndoU domain-containing protein [Clostridium sporogenes]MCW6059814.1 EndoU domain-containing protein [Clostridium sporogenes]MCW6067233.1 EndoU domain-containing protein [Clostridium sporogenes]
MKRDIKINYGKIEEIIYNISKYENALENMEDSLKYIQQEINNSTGESINALLDNYEVLTKNIDICKEELRDLRKILSDYINEMSRYAQAIDTGRLVRVDRNDVWWNIKSMEGIINQITDEQMRWGYNYSGSWSSDKDVIEREEHNGRQIESINHIVEKYVNILNQKIQEIYAIHNSKVIPFENTDDAFRDRAWNMYWKCTGFGDLVGDFFGFLDKSFNNIIDGVLKGLTDLVVGLAQLAIGAVEYVGSCAVVVLCEPFGGAPDWIKNKVDSDNKLISSILKDPALIIEGLAQDASDAIDEKGICYSVGYLGGTFLGTKGLDKITKGVKGLISGTETATIKSLEHGATQALKSIKDILNKAGNKSIEELNKIVTKVYSRVNGVLDVEVAGYGRIRIKESSILDDVDKICKDRYTKWAEGKSSEISHVKSIADLKNTENFRSSALNHILEGEINRSNMAVGYHYEKFPTSKGKIIEGTKSSPNDLGVYTGKVQVDGVIKKAKSSFFPEEWSPQEVIDAINEAYNNKQFVKGTKNTFRGKSVSGLKIEMYIDNKGKIISAFPKY